VTDIIAFPGDGGAGALPRALRALYAANDPATKLQFVTAFAAELAEDQPALDRLSESAVDVHGLGADDVQQAIVKGINRALDRRAEQQTKVPTRKRKREVQVTCFADITPVPIRWLWPDRIAAKLVLFTGPPDCGKTTCAIDIIARVTRGDVWPDACGNAPLGSAIFLTAEDGLADVIRPRLDAAGADVSRVHAIEAVREEGKPSSFDLAQDLAGLADRVREIGDVRVIVVDPITAYLGSNTDSHKTADVRALLSPLKDFADEHGVAVIGITHPSKSANLAMNAASGSQAFVAAARSAWLFVREKDEEGQETGRTLMLPIKNNLSAQRNNGLAYRLDGGVAWEGEVSMTADQALARAQEVGNNSSGDGDAVATAMRFVEEEFMVKDRIEAADLAEWAKRAGISERTLKRARQKMGIMAKRDGFGDGSKWYLEMPR
jgi:putative DNA primase/helicase